MAIAELTETDLETIEQALLNGADDYEAARAAGIYPTELAEWEHVDDAVHQRLEQARARNRIENLGLIKRAAIGHPSNIKTTTTGPDGERTTREVEQLERDWRAAAWLEDHAARARPLPPRSPGRGARLTAETHARIVESYRSNPHREPAAAAIGVSVRTLDMWLARGRAYRDFLEHGDIGDADQGTRRLYYAGQRLWATDRQAALTALALLEDRTVRHDDEPYLALVIDSEHAVGQLEGELSRLFLDAVRARPELAERALRLLFRNRYGNRLELTGAEGAPVVDLDATRNEVLAALDRVSEGRDRT